MNSKTITAAVAGTVVLFVAGYLFWGLLLADFFAANQGSATGVMREPPDFLVLGLGQLALGFLLATVLGWAGAKTPAAGFKTGAELGLLAGLGWDLILFATTNVATLTGALADAVVFAVVMGLGGAVVGMMLGRGASSA